MARKQEVIGDPDLKYLWGLLHHIHRTVSCDDKDDTQSIQYFLKKRELLFERTDQVGRTLVWRAANTANYKRDDRLGRNQDTIFNLTLTRFREPKNLKLLCQADEAGETPLHRLAYHGRLERVRAFLDAIPEEMMSQAVNARTDDAAGGKTPLMVAAEQGHGEVARALLQAGADRGLATTHRSTWYRAGTTADQIAELWGFRGLLDGAAAGDEDDDGDSAMGALNRASPAVRLDGDPIPPPSQQESPPADEIAMEGSSDVIGAAPAAEDDPPRATSAAIPEPDTAEPGGPN